MGHSRRSEARVRGTVASRAKTRFLLLTLLALGTAIATGVARAEPADAHAVLESTEPADGQSLDGPPDQVVLRFSESVQVVDGGIEVYEGSGDTLDVGEPEHPGGDGAAVAVDLPDISDGPYVVSWRVISSDSHPISGAFTFQVGDVDPAEAEALRASLGDAGSGGDDTLGVVYGVVRFAAFAGLILLVGGAAFALGVWLPGLRDHGVRRLVTVGWWLAVVATAASIGLQGAYGNGLTLGDAIDPSVIGDELGARAGRVWLVRLVLLAIVAAVGTVLLRRWGPATDLPPAATAGTGPANGPNTGGAGGDAGDRGSSPGAADGSGGAGDTGTGPNGGPDGGSSPGAVDGGGSAGSGGDEAVAPQPDAGATVAVAQRPPAAPPGGDPPAGPSGTALDEIRYVGSLLGLALLATISLAGHAGAGRLVGLAIVADMVHLAGVSVWLGGLAVLVLVVLRRGTASLDAPGLERVVARFSAVAFVAVIAIAASGVVQAWRQLETWSALFDTDYGRLLLIKVALVAAMVAAAGFSRAWLRGWFVAGTDRAAGSRPRRNGQRSDLYLLRQSVGIEAVLAIVVLAVTAALVQAPPEQAAGAGADSGPFQVELHGANVRVDVGVDPTTVGPVDVNVQVRYHDGTPLEPEEVSATLTLPERDLGPLDLALEPVGTGGYQAPQTDIPFPGEWEIEVVVRTSDIDQDRLTAPFTVG